MDTFYLQYFFKVYYYYFYFFIFIFNLKCAVDILLIRGAETLKPESSCNIVFINYKLLNA